MYRTLSELRDSINQMIESQGENAACAAFVFTQHDVFEYNEEDNQDQYFPTLFTQDVLADVGGSSYIYEQVGEMIDDTIRLRKKLPLYKWHQQENNLLKHFTANMSICATMISILMKIQLLKNTWRWLKLFPMMS